MTTYVVFSCDQNYFPLAKGLVLSLAGTELRESGIALAFIDIGCEPKSIAWFQEHGVYVLPSSRLHEIVSHHGVTGYHLAQICRPYLPQLFPDADAFIWLDSDLWVQAADCIKRLAHYARSHRDKLFICPEWHYAYTTLNSDIMTLHVKNIGFYYRMTYGAEIADKLSVKPLLNTGVFAMAASNPLWAMWAKEISTLYARDYGEHTRQIRHMAEQIALNQLAYDTDRAVPVDPLFNFSCMWALPYRDATGVVRVPLPPNAPIGIVHLTMWGTRRDFYVSQGLLYQQGRYLSEEERQALLP